MRLSWPSVIGLIISTILLQIITKDMVIPEFNRTILFLSFGFAWGFLFPAFLPKESK